MLLDLTVEQSIRIEAGAERVWDVLTSPELIRVYLYGTETVTTWAPGTPVVFQGTYEGQSYCDKGIVQENVPGRLLRYSYWSGFSGLEDLPENCSTITYTLTPLGDGATEFCWTQRGFASEAGFRHSQAGMGAFLGQIKALAEQGAE